MKVLSKTGRAIWLFETIEMNPRGVDSLAAYGAIRSKYLFTGPKTREDIENSADGIKFQNGSFRPNGAEAFEVNLEIYKDGIIAETKSDTELSELFLGDVMQFAKTQYGLYFEESMIRQRRYGSTLLFESDSGLARLSQTLSELASGLHAGTGRKYEVTGLTMGFNPIETSDGLGSLTIERRVGVPHAANRYFSLAPLQTEQHIALMERFEFLMA